jgi:hypothetical protein
MKRGFLEIPSPGKNGDTGRQVLNHEMDFCNILADFQHIKNGVKWEK